MMEIMKNIVKSPKSLFFECQNVQGHIGPQLMFYWCTLSRLYTTHHTSFVSIWSKSSFSLFLPTLLLFASLARDVLLETKVGIKKSIVHGPLDGENARSYEHVVFAGYTGLID